ncbi:retrotransposon-related protein, partial [Tanacetum coccineum]
MAQQQQQQAAAFQAQFETLRAELQASPGQLQGRPGGNGDQGSLLPRSMRLDVPKFTEEDPEKWLFAITEYFSLLNTPADQRLRIERFKETVMNHFGPSKYEDPQGALSKLIQLCIVEEYQGEFEKLMNWVMDIPDSLFISYYIFGLKLHLQRELLVSRPTTLGNVFSLAQIIEACFDDQAAPVACTSAGLEANKVVNDGDDSESSGPVTSTSDSKSLGEVKVLNWVHQSIDVESTYDNDARDQVSELEMKVLVDGNQDEAKVVKVMVVAVEQNIDEPDVEGNGVIGVGVNENNKGVQYSVSTLHVLILLLERLNDQYIKKKKMEAAILKRISDPEIKIIFLDNTLRTRSPHTLEVCKNLISKIQRRTDKEGQQIIPLLTDLWKRTGSQGSSAGNSLLDLRKIELRVERLKYSGVMDLIIDVQAMLKSGMQYFEFSHE